MSGKPLGNLDEEGSPTAVPTDSHTETGCASQHSVNI